MAIFLETNWNARPWTPADLGGDLLHWQAYETLDGLSLGAMATWAGSDGTPDLEQLTGPAQGAIVDVGGLQTLELDGTDDFYEYAGGGSRYAGNQLSIGISYYLESGVSPRLRMGVQDNPTANSWILIAVNLPAGSSMSITDDPVELGGTVGHQQALPMNVWHHDVWVYDGTKAAEIDRAAYWKDGKEWPTPKVSFPTFPPTILSSAANFRFGDALGHTTRFDAIRVRCIIIAKSVWTPEIVREVSRILMDATTVP